MSTATSRTPVAPIWWEKTVEYLYASREMSRYSFVAPLAGRQEAAGDVVLRDLNARWHLIEFKRTEADVGSELAKYDNASEPFRTFAAALSTGQRDVPHFIVFGYLDERGTLDLRARHYWGRWTGVEVASDRTVAVSAITKFGRTYDNFVKYLNVLLALKSKANSSSAGGREFQSVIGIAADRATAVSLSDFIEWTPKLARAYKAEPPPPAPQMPTPERDINYGP